MGAVLLCSRENHPGGTTAFSWGWARDEPGAPRRKRRRNEQRRHARQSWGDRGRRGPSEASPPVWPNEKGGEETIGGRGSSRRFGVRRSLASRSHPLRWRVRVNQWILVRIARRRLPPVDRFCRTRFGHYDRPARVARVTTRHNMVYNQRRPISAGSGMPAPIFSGTGKRD